MSKIIAFGNQKGGVGKSTLLTLCANALSQSPFSLKVCVIDTDPQRSLYEARAYDLNHLSKPETPPPYPVLAFGIEDFEAEIVKLDQVYDLILVDTAGRLDANLKLKAQTITKVLMYVDALFIPFRAGNFNLDASLAYLKTAKQIQDLRAKNARPLQLVGFVNMYKDRSSSNKQLLQELEHLATMGFSFMSCRLRQYALFEDLNTLDSLYDVNTTQTAKLNFTLWLNEFVKLINHG